MKRAPHVERALTLAACPESYAGVAADLSAFAESRALPGDVVTGTEYGTPRDFVAEVAEELADARNYLVWAMMRDGIEGRLLTALGCVVEAWLELQYDPEEADAEEELAARAEAGLPPLPETHPSAPWGFYDYELAPAHYPDIRPFREAIDAVLEEFGVRPRVGVGYPDVVGDVNAPHKRPVEGFGVKPRVGVASTPSSAASPTPCPECPLGGPCIGWEKFPGGPSACADDCDGLR